jgi:putative transposase
MKLGKTEQLDSLSLAAGELYTKTLVGFWRVVRKKNIWLKPSSLMRLYNSDKLHAHSADAVVQSFCNSLKSWKKRRKQDKNAKPPYKKRRYYKIQWKSSAIKIKGNKLILSNGKGNKPLIINWEYNLPKLVEIGWDGKQYELRAIYREEQNNKPLDNKVAGVDLGEIHLAVAYDGNTSYIINGRLLRSKRQYQNKLKAKLSSTLDKKKKGSKRWKKTLKSKQKQLIKIQNQINDILHKQTTKLVSTLYKSGVQTVVIGDVRNIRQNIDYGTTANQRLHQWVFGKVRRMIQYKAERLGMKVVLQDEKYTSQTCPMCNNKHKPNNRNYKCKCGFEYHRDAVGAINIRKKYLGENQVVGVMASPIGIRYEPNMQCSL